MSSRDHLEICGHPFLVASDCAPIYAFSIFFYNGPKAPSGVAINNGADANGYCKASSNLMDFDLRSPKAWRSSFFFDNPVLS